MKRAIGIIRVSQVRGREEEEGFHSPATQEEAIRKACSERGFELLGVHRELDVSGRTPLERRPGLAAAVEAVEAGRADTVVAAYFDRLLRSVQVKLDLVKRVEAAGGDVLALDMGSMTNGGATRKLTTTFLAAVAEYHADVTAEKAREAQVRAVKKGVAPWKNVPPGFLKPRPHAPYVVDPVLEPVIREAFERRARKESINSIRRFLAAHGVERTYGGVVELLTVRSYVGEVRFGELVNPEAHDPIVDRALFENVQTVRVPREDSRPPSERPLARLGVLRCAHCDSRMVVARGGNGNDLYRCPPNGDCRERPSITAQTVERLVVCEVKRLLAGMQGTASAVSRVQEAERALRRAQDELDAQIGALTAAGLLSEPAAIDKLRRLRDARDEAQERVYEERSHADATTVAVSVEDWDEAPLDVQRALIKAVIERVTVKRGGRGAERILIEPRS